MTDVKLPALPEEYEAMFQEALTEMKQISTKIKDGRRNKFSFLAGKTAQPQARTEDSGKQRETAEMIVPARNAGFIIGSHGDNLRRMEKQAQVKMQFDQTWQGNPDERRIVIVGFPEDIEEARRLVMEKINEDRFGRGSEQRRFGESSELMVAVSKIGLIIGRGGETVKELQDRSGAKIFVNQDAQVNPETGEKPVTITGDAEAVAAAKAMINEIINGGPNRDGRPAVSIQIPEHCVGAVMGARAEVLKSIIAASGTKIFVGRVNVPGTTLREIEISGPQEGCAYAVHLIQERVKARMAEDGDFSGANLGNYGDNVYNPAAAYGQPPMDSAAAYYQQHQQAPAYGYSQYYPQAQGAAAPEIDPNALAAYYAQYYAAAGYDSNAVAAAGYDPSAVPSYDPNAQHQ